MRILFILLTLITATPSIFCQTSSLKPVEIDGFNCFDTTQTKYIANQFQQSAAKDSIQEALIEEQDVQISTLKASNSNCEERVENLEERLQNAEKMVENEKEINSKSEEKHKEEKKRLRKNFFKVAGVAVVELFVLVLLLAAK